MNQQYLANVMNNPSVLSRIVQLVRDIEKNPHKYPKEYVQYAAVVANALGMKFKPKSSVLNKAGVFATNFLNTALLDFLYPDSLVMNPATAGESAAAQAGSVLGLLIPGYGAFRAGKAMFGGKLARTFSKVKNLSVLTKLLKTAK